MPTVTPDLVAKALAPHIKLHSQDPHQPCSVEWFLERCLIVGGSATINTGGITVPSSMSVLNVGPVNPFTLFSTSSSTSYGGGEIDDISLFPFASPAGREPVTDWTWPSLISGYCTDIGLSPPDLPVNIPDPHFYSYQQETFLGQHPQQGKTSMTLIYCRIATRQDYYLISYFGFFPYNGGLGPQTYFGSRPLQPMSGFGAHIGDWVRLTAKVKITNDLVSLLYVDYEAHGDQCLSYDANFKDLPLNRVPRLTAYSAWHSHELYPTAGLHLRTETLFTANDYTDELGVLWDTSESVYFITDDGPLWVQYNGLWGANLTVSGTIQNYLKNGPQGPAFHWYWTSETKDGNSPIKQWRMPSNPPLSAPTGFDWDPNPNHLGSNFNDVTLAWTAVDGATSYVVAFNRNGEPKSQQEVTTHSCPWPWTSGDLYSHLSMTVTPLGVDRPPGTPAVSPSFYATSDGWRPG